jgi:hypothetical protein
MHSICGHRLRAVRNTAVFPPITFLFPSVSHQPARLGVAHITFASSPDDAQEPAETQKSIKVAPWKLMGRVISEQQGIAFDERVQLGLMRSAAAKASGLDVPRFEAQLERLLVLLPFLQTRLLRMRPALIAALAEDVDRTAERIIALKDALPGVNIEAVISGRYKDDTTQ